MVVAAFLVKDRANQIRFFEETYLVANISSKVVFGIFFLTLSSANIDFLERELRWRTYTIEEVFPTTRRIKLIGKKEFAAATLDPEHETYVVYIGSVNSDTSPSSFPLNVYLSRRSPVSDLIAKKASIKVSAKYLDFADVFSPDLASELRKHTLINTHAIKLIDSQQPPYGPIYSLGPVELDTLKAYIETNLANGFIKLSKSPTGTPILFDQKSDGSLWLCVNYRSLNNLTIKNRYPLSLIGELLDRLGRVRQFI